MIRYDYSTGEYLTIPATFREDGTLTARSIITSIGVFPYRQKDGSIRRELRLPEEVFSQETLDSFNNLPIYLGHKMGKDGKLEKDQAKRDEWAVGVARNPIGDNVYVASDIEIMKEDGIEAVKSGIRSFSVGYSCDVVEEAGVWGGVPFDAIQRNIRGDHLALCIAARQGDQAVLRMDSAEMVVGDDAALAVEDTNSNKEGRMGDNMKTIQLDSVDYQAEPAVIDAYLNEKSRADSLADDVKAKDSAIAKLEAERDSAKEKLDSVEQKLVELEASKLDEAEINKRVEARMDLLALANDAKAEIKGDMSDMDIKKAIVLAVYPKTSLDGKSDEYIDARVDCAREDIALENEKNDTANVNEGNLPTTKVDSVDSAKEAYDRMVERLNAQGRK